MAFLEAHRLTRESWREASDEGRIAILCPNCGGSIELRPAARFAACPACSVSVLTPGDDVSAQTGHQDDKTGPLAPPEPFRARPRG